MVVLLNLAYQFTRTHVTEKNITAPYFINCKHCIFKSAEYFGLQCSVE